MFLGGPLFNDQTGPPLYAHYQFHPSLRMHPLRGKLEGLHSVSFELSYRLTLELLFQDRQILPVNVSDHAAVY